MQNNTAQSTEQQIALNSSIQAMQLSVNYGDTRVLDNLDLSVSAGSIVGLVGKNGAGKSTLIKSLLGLKTIDGGEVGILGQTPQTFSEDFKAQLGYVAQHPALPNWLSVQTYLDFRAHSYPNWDQDWVNARLFDWSVLPYHHISKMTTGQKQRLAIISEMAFRPQVLLLDEPVAGLDFASRMEFLREVIALCADFGTTILFSTHLFSDIQQVCSHIAWLHNGNIQLYAELDDIREYYQLITVTLNAEQKGREIPMPDSLVYRKFSDKTFVLLTSTPEIAWIEQRRKQGIQVTSEPVTIENLSLIQ